MQLREAADMLGVHYQTACQWARQGALPARKLGRGYEVDGADESLRGLAQLARGGCEPGASKTRLA
jgi:excisionase family DNA binding protein